MPNRLADDQVAQAIALLRQGDRSADEVAAQFGVTRGALLQQLRKRGIPNVGALRPGERRYAGRGRTLIPDATFQAAVREIAAGYTVREVAERQAIPLGSLTRYLRRHGLTTAQLRRGNRAP